MIVGRSFDFGVMRWAPTCPLMPARITDDNLEKCVIQRGVMASPGSSCRKAVAKPRQ
jgi:hypothetical protein